MIAFMLPILAILALLLGLMLLLGTERVRGIFHPEITRKFMHISIGSLSLSFPWIFSEPYQLWILAILATLTLLTVRFIHLLRTGIGSSLHAICRKSYGELCFPVAIASLFTLADGQILFYIIPLLVLTFADSLAALVGVFYGRHRYQSPDGSKTLEGSLTMFIVSMSCVALALIIAVPMTLDKILLVAFNLALVISVFEAICWRGLDNLVIPLAGFFLLKAYLPLSVVELGLHALTVSTLLVVVLLTHRRFSLRHDVMLAIALYGYVGLSFTG